MPAPLLQGVNSGTISIFIVYNNIAKIRKTENPVSKMAIAAEQGRPTGLPRLTFWENEVCGSFEMNGQRCDSPCCAMTPRFGL